MWLLGNGMTDSSHSGYSSFALDIIVQEACCQVTDLALLNVQRKKRVYQVCSFIINKKETPFLQRSQVFPYFLVVKVWSI